MGLTKLPCSGDVLTWNLYQQEEEQREDQGAAEDRCHPSAYNRKLRAMQSPNYAT